MELPQCLVDAIVDRLNFLDIANLKMVSKHWRREVTMAQYTTRLWKNESILLFHMESQNSCKIKSWCPSSGDRPLWHSSETQTRVPMATCKGLICYWDKLEGRLEVANPITGSYRMLPRVQSNLRIHSLNLYVRYDSTYVVGAYLGGDILLLYDTKTRKKHAGYREVNLCHVKRSKDQNLALFVASKGPQLLFWKLPVFSGLFSCWDTEAHGWKWFRMPSITRIDSPWEGQPFEFEKCLMLAMTSKDNKAEVYKVSEDGERWLLVSDYNLDILNMKGSDRISAGGEYAVFYDHSSCNVLAYNVKDNLWHVLNSPKTKPWAALSGFTPSLLAATGVAVF